MDPRLSTTLVIVTLVALAIVLVTWLVLRAARAMRDLSGVTHDGSIDRDAGKSLVDLEDLENIAQNDGDHNRISWRPDAITVSQRQRFSSWRMLPRHSNWHR